MSITVNQTGKNLRLKIYNEVSESHKVEKQCFRFCLNYKCLCLLSKFHPLLSSISSVQFRHPVVSDSLWPHGLQHARPPCPSPPPRVAQTHVHRVSDAIQPSHPLSPTSPAMNLFQLQSLFQWVESSIQVAKFWSFSFSISPSNKYSVLTSFRIVWFNLLAVQMTLKSHLQHHNFKPSVLQY